MPLTQAEFRAALLDGTKPVPTGLSDGRAHPAGRRFDVYRNNVAVSLTEALHSAFPTIAKLLGAQNMDGLAGLYLRAHPPATPLMMFYGESFPEFLAGFEQLAHLGYLPDVARLDLAMRHAYHAADAPPVDPTRLGQIAAEALAETRITLAPAVQLLRSAWPLYDIWRFNTEPGAPKPRHEAQDVLVTRPEFDPRPVLLPPGGAALVARLQSGDGLGAALDAALADSPETDPGALIGLLLDTGAIADILTEG